MEFGSSVLNLIGAFYTAPDERTLLARSADIRGRLRQLEAALGSGPFFAGTSFSIVDAVFGPAFRYFDVFDTIADFGFWDDLPKVRQWRQALAMRPSVEGAVSLQYPALLKAFLIERGSALSKRMS